MLALARTYFAVFRLESRFEFRFAFRFLEIRHLRKHR